MANVLIFCDVEMAGACVKPFEVVDASAAVESLAALEVLLLIGVGIVDPLVQVGSLVKGRD